MEKLYAEKKAALQLQERRHMEWTENADLNRNKVKTNRLTQRQSVNIPLMKETLKTLLAKIDDPPNVDWKELDGDTQKELYFQEIWNQAYKHGNLELKDVLDKKSVLLNGLTTKKLNLTDSGVNVDILDPYDVLYDPLMSSLDIETARFIVHQNIFRPLRDILADDRYAADGKEKLKTYLSTKAGIIQSSKEKEQWEKKMERLKAMGLETNDFPLFAAGDVIVNLSEHFTSTWNTKDKKFERRVVTYANDSVELLDETLESLIGVSFWPFDFWCEDPETNDIYPDSVADLVRTPNKIVNIWFSQLVENRTLRNFQMHWYDATVQGYQAQTYEPGPGRMLPAPGDPNKTIMPVNIQGMDEALTAIDFLIKVVERGTGATAIEKGVSEKKQITLGEVQVLVGKAMERAISMAKFYRASWYRVAKKWAELMHANPPKKIELYKISRSGKLYSKAVFPVDWKSEKGYEPMVSSTSEQEEEKTSGIQKFMAVRAQFPANKALARISQKRMLEILDLTPEEIREVEEEQKRMDEVQQQAAQAQAQLQTPGTQALSEPVAAPAATVPPAGESPETASLIEDITSRIQGAGIL